jgi:hypothetical protein
MTLDTRLAIVGHAIRWAGNILNEVVGNHGSILPADTREHLKTASLALGNATLSLRGHG